MNRREFVTLLCGVAAWPLGARAQQPALPVIGFLSANASTTALAAFRQGLKESGYVEGLNVAIELAEAQNDRLPALAVDLARRQVAAIAASGTVAALAAKAATTTIPIVFAIAANPVEQGLVASLNRPGGNLTGITTLNTEVASKRLEFLHELVPTAAIIALLVNPTNPSSEQQTRDLLAAARVLGVQLHVLHASSERDFDATFAALPELRAGGLVIVTDGLFVRRSEQLAALALRHAVPAIFEYREFAAAGGLISYGSSIADSNRLAGVYTGRILKGERPADLPTQQSTKIDLIVNLMTAKALGLTVPLSLLASADEVIE
jgi:putative ABC transport system substrate-binding protein